MTGLWKQGYNKDIFVEKWRLSPSQLVYHLERMIHVKKLCKILALTMMLVLALGLCAGASDFDSIAQELKDVGLFQGTDTGFELDRAPTRTEAAVMLVRLLGAEERATADFEAGVATHPFEDVPAWADAHVAWLFTKGLTNGVSETEFGANNLCNAQMYCTFVLRSLEYSDGENGQFTYDNALTFAAEKGLYNAAVFGGDFLRDDVVAISYQALSTALNEKETTLLGKLVADGAVTEEAAKPILDKAEIYAAYVKACAAFEDVKAMDMGVTGTMKMSIDGQDPVTAETTAAMKTIITDTDVQLEGVTTVKEGETETSVKQWIKDGVMYMDDGEQKIKMAMDFTDLLAAAQQQSANVNLANDGLYLIDTITATEDDNGTTYAITLTGALNSALDSVLGQMGDMGLDKMEIGAMTMSVVIDKDGVLKSVGAQLDMVMQLTVEEQTTAIAYEYDMVCTINAMGDSVTITFPDFTDFVEMTLPETEGENETTEGETTPEDETTEGETTPEGEGETAPEGDAAA